MGLAARLRLARLYLCTDAGPSMVILLGFSPRRSRAGWTSSRSGRRGWRRKAELEALETARSAAMTHQGIVCVNDSAELAAEFHADMLHLGQTDGPSGPARQQLHPWALLGRSTHSPEQVDAALADPDVNYFFVGPVYATSSKPDFPPVGLELVRYAAKVAPVSDVSSKPWFAIGGISTDELDDVIAAGARRIAVVRAITLATDPEAAAGELRRRLQAAWKAEPGMDRYIQHALASG